MFKLLYYICSLVVAFKFSPLTASLKVQWQNSTWYFFSKMLQNAKNVEINNIATVNSCLKLIKLYGQANYLPSLYNMWKQNASDKWKIMQHTLCH
jgi:hypothetical protein